MKTSSSKLKFDFCEIFLREDNIFQVNVFPNSVIDQEQVKTVVDALLQLSKGVKLPAITFLGEFTEISKEAREYIADPNKPTATTAIAFVINNMGHKIVGNFFLTVNKPTKPIRFFTDAKLAIEWLNAYKPTLKV